MLIILICCQNNNVFQSLEQFILFLLFQFRYGMVELLPVPDPTNVIKELISYGLERTVYLQTKKHNLHKENQRLRNELEHVTAE